jgi:hypothetical protein
LFLLDLSNKNIIVTVVVLKLDILQQLKFLRIGVNVIIKTLFPLDALKRYQNENNFLEWNDILYIYGLGFLSFDMVDGFCKLIKSKYDKIYLLVNNATQTIKRPVQHYKHLVDHNIKSIECNNNYSNIIAYNQKKIIIKLDDYKVDDDKDYTMNEYKFDGQQIDLRMNNSWIESIKEIDIHLIIK